MSITVKQKLLKTAETLDKLADSLEMLNKVAQVEERVEQSFEKRSSAKQFSLGSVGDKPVKGDNPFLDFLLT